MSIYSIVYVQAFPFIAFAFLSSHKNTHTNHTCLLASSACNPSISLPSNVATPSPRLSAVQTVRFHNVIV